MMSFAVITIILDFAILLLPIPLVMGLQLSKKQRIAVITLFGLGFIVCIAGIVQAYYIEVALKESYDETWDGWPLWVASAVEVDLGIVSHILHQNSATFTLAHISSLQLCVSIPAIRPFLAIYVPKLLESTGISGKSSKQSSSSGSHSRNPFRYAARTANTPWAKDLAGGSWKKDKAGSTEKKDSEVVGVLEREVSGSEEREFGVDQDSKV